MSDRPICCGRPTMRCGRTDDGKRYRWKCNSCGTRTTGTPAAKQDAGYDLAAAKRRAKDVRGRKRFVITSAQNNTAVHKGFLASLLKYCEHSEAALLVVPVHYKNVSLYTASQQYEKQWARELWPFIVDNELKLGGNVVLRADVHISASTLNPLTGKEPINGTSWTIFGHPQFAMEPVASPGGVMPKRMYTTGSLTLPNYSATNLGARAEFHHVQGALVVEIAGKHAFIRQLNADSKGRFCDLDKLYTPDGVSVAGPALALTTGDEHVKFHAKAVRRATYDAQDSIVKVMRPKFIVRHDVIDGYAGSHHHEHDDVLQFRKHHKKDNDYRAELDQVVKFLDETTPKESINLIVPSNHHDHLYKWLSRVDPRKDQTNALLIHELKAAQYANALAGNTTDPFEIYVKKRVRAATVFLDRSKPHVLGGVNYNQHGDIGTNGSRGSARALARTTYKMVIGHSHGARIVRGVYQVGTSANPMEYEKGLGDHTHTHCIQYANGKRTLVDIINGKWRL